jgi:hypothetical protein
MSLTRKAAISEMATIFKTAWDTTGYGTRVKYDNVGVTTVPPSGVEPWARFTLRHAASEQATLSGVVGSRRFRRTGILVVGIFTPPGDGLSGATDLAKIIQDAYEGVTSPNGVIFRGVAINEVGPDGDFFQTNVVVNFEYDEVK